MSKVEREEQWKAMGFSTFQLLGKGVRSKKLYLEYSNILIMSITLEFQ